MNDIKYYLRMTLWKEYLIIFMIILASGCTMTESGLVFGIPDYEAINIEVENVDSSILKRAGELLPEKIRWAKLNESM